MADPSWRGGADFFYGDPQGHSEQSFCAMFGSGRGKRKKHILDVVVQTRDRIFGSSFMDTLSSLGSKMRKIAVLGSTPPIYYATKTSRLKSK